MAFRTNKQTKTLPHIIINAGPGVGKTSTMIAGLQILSGGKPEWEGTDEQKAIWEAMRGHYTTIGFQAFNKSIANEIQEKVPPNVRASTFHAFGFKVLRDNGYNLKPNGNNVRFIVKDLQGYDAKARQSTHDFKAGLFVSKLVSLLKGHLFEPTPVNINSIIDNFSLVLPKKLMMNTLVDLCTKTMKKCLDVKPNVQSYIDFDDMLWLPLKLELDFKPSQFDLLICDECFPAGTTVPTNFGIVPIEQIASEPEKAWEALSVCEVAGLKIKSYTPVTTAYKTLRKNHLVKVTHEQDEIICTANHPIWTKEEGWVKAGLLSERHTLCYLYEADKEKKSDMFEQMCGGMEEGQQRPESREAAEREDIEKNEGSSKRDPKSDEEPCNTEEDVRHVKAGRPQTSRPRRERERGNSSADETIQETKATPSGLAMEPRTCNIEWSRVQGQRSSDLLQSGHSNPEVKSSDRSGRVFSQQLETPETRSEERTAVVESRVVSVASVQQANHGGCNDGSQESDFVYTLSTEVGNYFADGLLVKNCQDLNPIQHELVLKSGSRLICVGDRRQSIYGFRGADSNSMNTLRDVLSVTDRGVIELDLQTSFRLPKTGVANVNDFAPNLKAADKAIKGSVKQCPVVDMKPKIGDLILSRINANIFSTAFSLLRQKIAVRIQGRDFGNQLKNLLESTCEDAGSVEEIMSSLTRYEKKEHDRLMQRTFPERGLSELEDRMACLYSLTKGCDTVDEMTQTIDELFSEDLPRNKVVLLSTIHRAKGMEADTVYFLEPQLVPHPLAETENEIQQEMNLKFVAETRHKKNLVYVYQNDRGDDRDEMEGRITEKKIGVHDIDEFDPYADRYES